MGEQEGPMEAVGRSSHRAPVRTVEDNQLGALQNGEISWEIRRDLAA